MKNPFKKRETEAEFSQRLNDRVWRASEMANIPGVTIDEVRDELLLGPHPDPTVGAFSLNLPLEALLDFDDPFEDEDQQEYNGKLIPFRGPDEDPAA